MRLKSLILSLAFSFYFVVNAIAQQTNPIPTEAQGQQVIGSLPMSTCVNYGRTATDCPCLNNGSMVASADTNTNTAYDSEGLISVASKIDFKFNHIHTGKDYNSLADLPGCSTCGGGSGQQDQLPSLYLNRLHRFRDITEISSFGPGVFSNYDMSLTITPDGAGNRVRFFDSQYYYTMIYQDGVLGDVKDGVFYENLRQFDKARITNKLEMLNASSALTSDLALAKTCVITNQNGRKFIFEINYFSWWCIGWSFDSDQR